MFQGTSQEYQIIRGFDNDAGAVPEATSEDFQEVGNLHASHQHHFQLLFVLVIVDLI